MQEKPATRQIFQAILEKEEKSGNATNVFRFKSEKVKIVAVLCKTFGSNTGKRFYWLVGLKMNFQNVNQCRLIHVELL